MAERHIVAIFSPKPGNEERVRQEVKSLSHVSCVDFSLQVHQLLVDQCREVYSKEDYALRFIMTKQVDMGNPDFILFETYKDREAIDQHLSEPHFKHMSKVLTHEGLLEKPPYVAITETNSGFDLDKKFYTS